MRIRPVFAAVALAAATALLVSACSSSKSSSGKTASDGSSSGHGALQSIQVMEFPGQDYRLAVDVAQQQGLFAQHGVKVNIIAQPNNLQGAQAMIATHSQVGILSASTLAQGVENGTPVAYFCGSLPYLQTTLIAKAGSSLPSTSSGATWQQVLGALKGKKVGIQTPVGSGLQLLFAAALKEAGVTNVTYVNVGGGNNLTLAALQRGSVDVAQANPPGTQEFGNQVKPLLYLPDGPPAYKLYGSAWTGQTSWLKSNPTAAKGFCDAITEATAFIQKPSNLAAAAKALSDDTKISTSLATKVIPATYGDYSTILPQAQLTNTFKMYYQFGITKTDMSTRYNDLVKPVS